MIDGKIKKEISQFYFTKIGLRLNKVNMNRNMEE